MLLALKEWSLKLSYAVMILVIVASFISRFYKIDQIPYGYHVDELCGAVTAECLAKEGIDAQGNSHPVFFQTNYGSPRPWTYMYPAVIWGKFFGFSVGSLRAYGAFVHFIGIVGLFFLGRRFFGNTFGLWAAFLGAISPWLWPTSRVAIEPLFAPTFSIWALYFFFRKPAYWSWALSAVLFSASMYSYPAMRLQVPIMLITLFVYSLNTMKFSFLRWVVFAVSLVAASIPLALKILSGEVQGRFNEISITSPGFLKFIGKTNSFKDIWEIFVSNVKLHLSPDFLLFKGDPSLVHSTGHWGILSWLDVTAIVLCGLSLLMIFIKPLREKSPWRQDGAFLVLCLLNIFLGIIPSAITNSEIPHALRVDGGWPFLCLLTAYFICYVQRYCWPLGLAALLAGVLFFLSYSKTYFTVYQQESKGMFSFWTLDQANTIKSEEDWRKFLFLYRHDDYHARYFLMNYRKESCTSSRLLWENQRKMLRAMNID